MSKKTAAVLIVLILVVTAVAIYFYYQPQIDAVLPELTSEQPAQTDHAEEQTTVPAEYEEYYAKNNDFVGWIKIDGTTVDYPVLQAEDDSYYLHRNFEKEYEGRGSIYMASDCNAETLDTNTVIYGHNWLDTTMFSQLVKYSDFDFYKEHPVIEFNTRYEMHKWKIFAVFITTATASEDNGYVFNFVYPHMGGVNYEGYMAELQKRSLYDTGVDVNENDKFLTLSTCTREVDTDDYRADCRIVIVARMVRDGESASVDTSAATENANPKYPQIWYDKYGLENPYKGDALWYPKENDPEQASSTTNEAS